MMSRYAGRHSREKKGHGAIGFLVTFGVIVLVLVLVFFFVSDSSYKGVKGKVYSLLYPQEYETQVKKSAAEFGVDEALIYAVIRTESGFREEIESYAGAVGLMQLMPDTFTWLQEQLDGEVVYDASALTDPDINVRYGTYMLSMLLKQYDNNIRTVAAAYNAGTNRVDGWLEDSAVSSDGKTLTDIPYGETATYVENVDSAYEMYKKLYY